MEAANKVRDFLAGLSGLQEEDKINLDKLENVNSRYLKDLRVNLSNTLQSVNLSEKDLAITGFSVAVNQKNKILQNFFEALALDYGASSEEIAETIACTSLLAGNNVLYRFRHFTGKEKYETTPARIKMNIMANPVLGKPLFELISLVVSAINGCERCVNSHEKSLLELGYSEEQIFDAVRLGSVVVSFSKIIGQ